MGCGSMTQAFISYRRQDSSSLATLLAMSLKQHRIDAFVDTRSIDGGGPFPDRLRRAIDEAEVFVCLLGETTLQSEWVREEIRYAHEKGKTMIPVFQERYHAPNPIPDEHVFALLQSDGVHILDVRNVYVDEGIATLAKLISGKRSGGGASTVRSRRLSPALGLLALILVIGTGVFFLISSGVLNPSASTPTPDARGAIPATTAADESVLGSGDVTDASPMPAETELAADGGENDQIAAELAMVDALVAGTAFDGSNGDWAAFIHEFGGVPMALVPKGCFTMGTTEQQVEEQKTLLGLSESARELFSYEQPATENVCFEIPFWIDKFEVTNAQFVAWGGVAANDPTWVGDDHAQMPRDNITWDEAQAFCERRDGRLPTEAEWEYAARGPEGLIFPWGFEPLPDVAAWLGTTEGSGPLPVGSFGSAGASWVGAEDMSGNIAEWTYSLFWGYPYRADARDDGTPTTDGFAVRGGTWNSDSLFWLRTTPRLGGPHVDANSHVGFRCMMPAA